MTVIRLRSIELELTTSGNTQGSMGVPTLPSEFRAWPLRESDVLADGHRTLIRRYVSPNARVPDHREAFPVGTTFVVEPYGRRATVGCRGGSAGEVTPDMRVVMTKCAAVASGQR